MLAQCKMQRPRLNQRPVDPIPLDIPTPVSTTLYQRPSGEFSSLYSFSHSHDAAYYKKFYQSAMQEVGWFEESCVEGTDEIVFIFKKPRKWCMLILEPYLARFFIKVRTKKESV